MNIHVTSGSAEPLQPKAPEQRFIALLPCPFCGGAAQFGKCEPGDVEAENDGAEYIECEACGASTCLVFPCMDAAKPRLCELWNNRAKAEPVAWHNPRADALRSALRDIADTKNLTATPTQFARWLQRTAETALTDDAMAEPAAPPPEPVAYLHTVRVVSPHANHNKIDQVLSFSSKSFPLGATGMFESIGVRPLVFGDGKA